MPRGGKSLTIMPTFQCNAECRHCGTASSPRDTTWLNADRMLALIDEAARLEYGSITFSGGEPSLAGETLVTAMRRAASYRLPVRLVTNARWAVDDGAAERQLFEWMFAGLTEVHLSTGDEHARFVPMELVRRAACAAVTLGLPACVIVEIRMGNRIGEAELADLPIPVVPRYWSDLHAFPQAAEGGVNDGNVHERGGCDELFGITTVQANGAISPCCGLGIRLIPELQLRVGTLEEADRTALADPWLRRIHEEGPERMLAAAAERDSRIAWENRYAHRCHACIRVHRDPAVRAALMA